MKKVCNKCGDEKDCSEFHKDKQRKDGRKNECKVCIKARREGITTKECLSSIQHKNKLSSLGLKVCLLCLKEKSISEFGKNKTKKDGLKIYCKECKNQSTRDYYYKNKDSVSIKNKSYAQTLKGRQVQRNASRKHKANNVEKYKAKDAVNGAIKYKRLVKPSICSICGKDNARIEGHHWSYKRSDWLDVVWCCKQCHCDIHNDNIKDIFRRQNQSLLEYLRIIMK